MSNIDKRSVQAVADLKSGYTLGHADVAILNELARIALASLEAEAVYQFIYNNPYEEGYTEWLDCNKDYFNGVPEDCRRILYTVPPAPVSVPDEAVDNGDPNDEFDYGYVRGWNECRAVMLHGAAGNSQVIPDGWVTCSDQNPEKGRCLALFGKRTKENCDPYVDEGYLGSDGEFYFFDWESGPRIDDCHPYDKAIVSHWMYWELPAAPQQEAK